ncbi:MAG: ATP-binding protein [candidate division FCPU426 bacterium]
MIVAVASGKGGTGKTTVSLNLANAWPGPVQLVDCDVEEPNCHLFLQGLPAGEKPVALLIPQVDESRCDGCGECSRFCQFHAIAAAGGKALVFSELCHACGGCSLVCPRQAIREVPKRIGVVSVLQAGQMTLIQGRLDVGVATAPPLIRAVKACVNPALPVIVDAPPGTSCPVVAAVREANYVLLVTEPTPFGLHDLTLAVDTIRALKLPFGVVVNRMGVGDDRVQAYCRQQGIEIMLEIPDDRRIAEAYSRAELAACVLPEYGALFHTLRNRVLSRMAEAERNV